DLDRRLDAVGRFLEGDLEVVAQIRAALRAAAPAAAEAEDVAEAAEDVLEAVEDGGIETARARAGPGVHAGVAAAVAEPALCGVGEDGVRLRGFLELFFGRLVARIAIGMEPHRELAIGALDFAIGRRTRDAEHLVVVDLAHDAFATFTMAGRSSRSPI